MAISAEIQHWFKEEDINIFVPTLGLFDVHG